MRTITLEVPMDDRLIAQSVELVVDATGKVWLNVDEVCVARIGYAKVVCLDLPPAKHHQEHNSHIVLAFPEKK